MMDVCINLAHIVEVAGIVELTTTASKGTRIQTDEEHPAYIHQTHGKSDILNNLRTFIAAVS